VIKHGDFSVTFAAKFAINENFHANSRQDILKDAVGQNKLRDNSA
jgi:hypothetical protein